MSEETQDVESTEETVEATQETQQEPEIKSALEESAPDLSDVPGFSQAERSLGALKFDVPEPEVEEEETEKLEESEESEEGEEVESTEDTVNEEDEIEETGEETEAEESDDEVTQLTEQDAVEIVNQFADGTGYSFESKEDFDKFVGHYNELVEAQEKRDAEYRSLSDEERAALASMREHGDPGYYNKINSIDVGSLSSKEALKQDFLLKEENRGRDEGYLSELFEREYKAKYDSDTEDEAERAFEQRSLEDAVSIARKNLSQRQEEVAGIGDKFKVEDKSDENLEQERAEQERLDQEWFSKTDSFLDLHDGVEYSLDEDVSANLNFSGDDLNEVKEAMNSPHNYLAQLSTDDNGNASHDLLFENLIMMKYGRKLIAEAFEQGKVFNHEKSLEEKRGAKQETRKQPTGGKITLDDQRTALGKGWKDM